MNSDQLVNYQTSSSGMSNYNKFETSSSPGSFPSVVGNGIFIEYKQMKYTSNLMEEQKILEPKQNNTKAPNKTYPHT